MNPLLFRWMDREFGIMLGNGIEMEMNPLLFALTELNNGTKMVNFIEIVSHFENTIFLSRTKMILHFVLPKINGNYV
jgi:hypothetical protein